MDDARAKFAELDKLIAEHKHQKGALMPVLQGAQAIFGCVPEDVQKVIAEGLGVTLSEVYGVATFYAQFSLHPKGEYLVSVCLGTACYVKGSQNVLDRLSKVLDVPVGGTAKVVKIHGEGAVKRRIMDMGITKGIEIYVRKVAPLGDPIEVTVRGYELSLRKADAEDIEVE